MHCCPTLIHSFLKLMDDACLPRPPALNDWIVFPSCFQKASCGGAKIMFGKVMPVQAVIVGVVDGLEVTYTDVEDAGE